MTTNTQVAKRTESFGALLKLDHERRALSTLLETDPKGLTRYIAQAYMLVMGNPKLSECTPLSLLRAVKDAASVRLTLDPILGQAYIVPYNKKDGKGWISEAQFQLGYKGVIALALRSNTVLHIDARVVWAWDDMRLTLGTAPSIQHTPNQPTGKLDHDNVRGAYMVAFMRDGTTKLTWMWRDEIDECRARSKSWQMHVAKGYQSPWADHYAAMALTKVVHRGGKQLELSPRDMRGILISDANSEGQEGPREVEVENVQNDADLNALLDQPLPTAPEKTEEPEGDAVDVRGAQVKPAQDPPGGGKLSRSTPASEPIKLPEYYHHIELVGVASPETWLDQTIESPTKLNGTTYRAAAASTDKDIAAVRLAVLNEGARLQADNGKAPTMHQRLAAACWLQDNGARVS